MRRPEVKETLAQITFNEAAAREYFEESSKGVRLRIEQGVVTFRPTNHLRGADVIAIERRPRRGIAVEIARGQESRRLMTRLFRAGLSENQPYFALEPAARGWFAIDHVADHPEGAGQPLMLVSKFETPPPPMNMLLWRRFLRSVKDEKPIDQELWNPILQMLRGAAQIAGRPQRGRASQERVNAEKLLTATDKNAAQLLAWCERQPEYGNDVAALFSELRIEPEPVPPVATVIPIKRRHPVSPPISTEVVRKVLADELHGAESEDLPTPKRKRPNVDPVAQITEQDNGLPEQDNNGLSDNGLNEQVAAPAESAEAQHEAEAAELVESPVEDAALAGEGSDALEKHEAEEVPEAGLDADVADRAKED